MRFVTSEEMRRMEGVLFAAGEDAGALMRVAGWQVARVLRWHAPEPGHAVIYGGKGNNGGDAWVAAGHLLDAGWTVEARGFTEPSGMSALCAGAWNALRGRTHRLSQAPDLVLDGILGTGSRGILRDPVRQWCREINRMADEHRAFVCAIDLPTGLDGDSGQVDPDTVRADLTVTLGLPKRGMIADGAVGCVGCIEVAGLGVDFEPEGPGPFLTEAVACRRLLPRRHHAVHKGDCGRVAVFAGSPGFTGAATLCAAGAVRAGAGLVTLWVPAETAPVLAAKARAEVMVAALLDPDQILESGSDVLVLGPGAGRARDAGMRRLLEAWQKPVVIDADALNLLAAEPDWPEWAHSGWLLTPHEGEMERICARLQGETRAEWASRFCSGFPGTLLLKGARTLAANENLMSLNASGNAGMATGGMGDVLAGVAGALMGQGMKPFDAACCGAWLTGRAADWCIGPGGQSPESLLAMDVVEALGRAFRSAGSR